MVVLRVIQQDKYDLRFPQPTQTNPLINLSDSFIAYEETLPLEQRSPYYPTIKSLLIQVQTQQEAQTEAENKRTIASEQLKRHSRVMNVMLDRILVTLKAKCFGRPEEAQAWGFEVRQGTGNILKPDSRASRVRAVQQYIKKEQSRPAEAQFTEPPLAEVIDLYENMRTALLARDGGVAVRQEASVDIKNTTASLYNYLQIALHGIMERHYSFDISPGLEKWGFDVVWRRNGTAVNGKTNGSDDVVAEDDSSDSLISLL
ncbi:MAG: hypothetical protein H6631_04705 [Anaerolineaceae bacterium]|nr:hypothetical protein [Anaerolineaceae bacterium]